MAATPQRICSCFAALAALATSLAACGGGNLASGAVEAPKFEPKEGRCTGGKSQSRPLIVEWPSSDRATLEARIKQGVVPVRYVGCEMEVLPRCQVPKSGYGYTGITRKNDQVHIKNSDELYANIPVYAAKLEGTLAKSGALDVNMTIVGRWDASMTTVRADQLQGECEGATHVVAALTVGAFEMLAGADASGAAGVEVLGAGAGAKSSSSRQTLNKDGDEGACTKAVGDEKSPPFGCGALLRVEVVPLGQARQEQPTCPAGTAWDGNQCVASVDKSCPQGMHFEAGKGCVGNVAAAAKPPPPAAAKPLVAPTSSCTDKASCETRCNDKEAGACVALSSMLYADGKGSAADGPRALDLASKACDEGQLRGCVVAGEILYNGFGMSKDPSKSAPRFAKACDGGESTGCVDLGWSYLYGMGVSKDPNAAAASFGKACNATSALGCIGLGGMYRDGRGVASDKHKANQFFKQACDAGVGVGCKMMAQ